MKKTTQLRNMLRGNELEFLMEAHNGLSARIVEEAGFKGIWASGLSISAALGVRDNNEASWTQVLETVEFMSDATTIPILLDGDTGYGNFNNMRRLVKKLEQRDIAGVCIEDKIFPKTNSFLRGEKQPLAEIEEFAGKIKAGLDARRDEDFNIVARVEAFIAGWGLEEALKRAEAYHEAGANAILMHSKKSTPEDIEAFMKHWGDRCPVVIVPTKYYGTPTQKFRDLGVSTVIWANHNMRAAISVMQNISKQIYEDQSLINVEDKVVPVKEVFRLQNDEELEQAEKLYFGNTAMTKGLILAASRGKEIPELTENRPKCLLEVNGNSILKQSITKQRANGINDIHVVRGYKKETFPDLGVNYVDNDLFETTGELYSLNLLSKELSGDCFISYGDIAYRGYILQLPNESEHEITLIADSSISTREKNYVGDFVYCDQGNSRDFNEKTAILKNMKLSSVEELIDEAQGEWIGIVKTTSKGSELLKATLQELSTKEEFTKMKMADLFSALVAKNVKIGVKYIEGHWMDVDHYKDFELLQGF